MAPFKHAIALTGGIATGKSAAVEVFRSLGFESIDADTIAHEMLASRAKEVAEMFDLPLSDDGQIDRRTLGQIVFADPAKRHWLEALLHPLIEAEIVRQSQMLDLHERPYLVDIPLFFERGAYAIESVIVVYAPRELQMERLMARNGLTRPEARLRLDAQMPIEEKRRRATWVIDNTADRAHLQNECKRIAEQIAGAGLASADQGGR